MSMRFGRSRVQDRAGYSDVKTVIDDPSAESEQSQDLAPSPTAYLLGALAGCAVAFLHDTLAPLFDVAIDDATAVARCSTDARGLLGIDGVAPDLADIELEIRVASTSPKANVDAMFAAWRERCPIYLALIKVQSVALTATVQEGAAA